MTSMAWNPPRQDVDERSLVVLLHGFGSSGSRLAPLRTDWWQRLPGTDFAAPDAPFVVGGGRGRQWFDNPGREVADTTRLVTGARAAFDEVLRGILDMHELSDRLDRVALVGFSQGAVMALDAVASGRCPVAAVVAFSGRLASPWPLTPARNTQVMLVHGDKDPTVGPSESLSAARILQQLGVEVRVHLLAGLGHAISPAGLDVAGSFLAEVLCGTEGRPSAWQASGRVAYPDLSDTLRKDGPPMDPGIPCALRRPRWA